MIWVTPLSVLVLLVGIGLTVAFLTRNQWTLDVDSCEVRVRTSLIRASMYIDGDRVSDVWRKPGERVLLKAAVDDAYGRVATYTAVVKPRMGRPSCQIFVDGDWMGGDLLEGTRFEPATWRTEGTQEDHLDTRWSTARRLLMRVQDVVGWDERIRSAVDALGRRSHERLTELHRLRREGGEAPATLEKMEKLELEIGQLMQSIQMLHMTITSEQHESAMQALKAAEVLVEKLKPPEPPPPPLVTRTLKLKTMKVPAVGEHSGASRAARRAAMSRLEEDVSDPPTDPIQQTPEQTPAGPGQGGRARGGPDA